MADMVRLVGGPYDGQDHAWPGGNWMVLHEASDLPLVGPCPNLENVAISFVTHHYRRTSRDTATWIDQ